MNMCGLRVQMTALKWLILIGCTILFVFRPYTVNDEVAEGGTVAAAVQAMLATKMNIPRSRNILIS